MAAALPITKLGGLLIKTLAKPMAKRIKHEFSRFPSTQKALISIGQTAHQMTSRLTIWSAGYKVRNINPLEPEKALSKGADILGESFVFAVGGGVVVYDYTTSQAKSKAKEQKNLEKIHVESRALQEKLHALDARLKALEKVVKANNKALFTFRGEKYVEPEEVKVSFDDDDDMVEVGGGDKHKGEKGEKKQQGRTRNEVLQPNVDQSEDALVQSCSSAHEEQHAQLERTKTGWWQWALRPFRGNQRGKDEN
mmetsp:Transcript_22869/g.33453  ORF Transcript_22869/g.33453 Transcript_22869/m.33453 type:complete len:252 (-) Transcript_22869:203-958(-)|eukprot:CAMPEP_0195526692 /NCGR_PEP_ID=MMETSP0794_2-20130614/27921_1 /TAXON_ID=515487 /ORGANISM="Stephanopyxis turris, Strain CCMP 815" /LENGTH=251 /DNA_ID=CAMNT_0040657445 /DNA_START=164 /DNA_END=919 /DNA_ORIENTATION=+